jgi:hypothetical protein
MKIGAFGQIGFAATVFGLGWGCTMATEKQGDSSQDLFVVTPTATIVSTPVVAPPMGLTNATPSCDLREYFPDAHGAAGGWTTGTCGSQANYPWLPPSVCSLDEMFDNWSTGPAVQEIGNHCRAAMAGTIWRAGIYQTMFVPTTNPPERAMISRSDGPYPYNACVCVGIGEPWEKCYEYGYEFVICPFATNNNLNSSFTANHTTELNQHVMGYCNPGTTALGAQTGSSYGVVYAYDPKCPNCVPCGGT